MEEIRITSFLFVLIRVNSWFLLPAKNWNYESIRINTNPRFQIPKLNMHKPSPDQVKVAFELYLKYNGESHDRIEREMRSLGYRNFSRKQLIDHGSGNRFRKGWISRYGWQKALEFKLAFTGTIAVTSAESLLFEVEIIRKQLFHELQSVGTIDVDLLKSHERYSARSAQILASLEDARDNYANFVFFLRHLLTAATRISPDLAKAICVAEDALIEWAEREFVT